MAKESATVRDDPSPTLLPSVFDFVFIPPYRNGSLRVTGDTLGVCKRLRELSSVVDFFLIPPYRSRSLRVTADT